MSQSCLCTFDERLSDVGDTESGLVGRNDVIIDDGGQVEGDVILGHADLSRNLDNLNLDIDLDEFLGQRVDLDQAGIDGASEAAEFGDQTDVSLGDGFVRVGADDTAGDGSEETNAGAERVDCIEMSIGRSLGFKRWGLRTH